MDRIHWTDDGWPYVGSPGERSQPTPFVAEHGEEAQQSQAESHSEVIESRSAALSEVGEGDFLQKVSSYFDLRPPYPTYVISKPLVIEVK